MLDTVADMELKFIKDWQKAGVEAAKAEGVYKGRKENVDDDEIRRQIAAGANKARVARSECFEDENLGPTTRTAPNHTVRKFPNFVNNLQDHVFSQ